MLPLLTVRVLPLIILLCERITKHSIEHISISTNTNLATKYHHHGNSGTIINKHAYIILLLINFMHNVIIAGGTT